MISKYRHIIICIFFLQSVLFAGDKYSSFSKAATVSGNYGFTIIDIGMVHNYVSSSTYDFKNGKNLQTFSIGRSDLIYPSMAWLEGGYPDNNYLYRGRFFIGYNENTIRFDEATCNDFRVIREHRPEGDFVQVHFSLTDDLTAPANYVGIRCINNVYAWSQPIFDDFLIYEYAIINNSGMNMTDVYSCVIMDCDVSSAGGGESMSGFYRDDNVNFLNGTDPNGNPESISYMFDDDNPTIPGNDIGGILDPLESTGYIGTRIVKSPATTHGLTKDQASGHFWWGWAIDPQIGKDYYDMMKNEKFIAQPGSPHDYRYMQTTGPWDIPADDTLTVAYAFGIGEGLAGLRQNLQNAYDLYHSKGNGPTITAYSPQTDSLILYVGETSDFSIECARQDSLNFRWMIDKNYVSDYDADYSYTASKFDIGNHYIIAVVDGPRYRSSKSWDIEVRPAKKYALLSNYPNPFNGFTTIPFELEKDGTVKLVIYDVLGRKVKTLLNKPLAFGKHEVQWDGTDGSGKAVSSGIYFYDLQSGRFKQTKRLLILR